MKLLKNEFHYTILCECMQITKKPFVRVVWTNGFQICLLFMLCISTT